MSKIKIRKGMPSVALTRAEFTRRVHERFFDPAFNALQPEIDKIIATAWDGYHDYRKAPRTKPAGQRFADPGYDLSIDWSAARQAVDRAARQQKSAASKSRILLINGSSRSDQTCPGEMSKTFRLVEIARRAVERERGFDAEVLDLSRLTSEYGRQILPCKSCVATAMPLCHWPCSCYPNHAMGQVNDWMAEIYPMWVAAHGVMIVTPVNWYQAPSGLKSMIDRLVCADGGNPDPTTTQGKDPKLAKEIELKGWDYPRHLAGRAFSVVVHGDTAGTEVLRRILTDWLGDLGLIGAGHAAEIDRYIGYYKPYATSHDDLDDDKPLQEEVRNAALMLIAAVKLQRRGKLVAADAHLRDPRPK
ncbi:MAG: flavodoxin family protein [bacterium]|nr:flavodoxin family protein [bacterium]